MAAAIRKRGRTWEHQETVLLIEKWGDTNTQERLKECSRKKPIWEEISVFLRAAGYTDRDHESCKTRIHTLVNAYRLYKDECSHTGNSTPRRKAPFFEQLDEILSNKPATKPTVVISSATAENVNRAPAPAPVVQPDCEEEQTEREHQPEDNSSIVEGM